MAPRRLNSWIGGFLDYTKPLGVSTLFRKWAALATVSGALERRACLVTSRGELYPNLFVLLVSPPGVGKSIVINAVREFWASTAGLTIAPASTTRSGLIDFMCDHKRVDTSTQLPRLIHSVLFASGEFIDLVPEYNNAWLGMLHSLYDCAKTVDDVTIAHGARKLENTHMVLLAGTQPKFLDSLLPEEAYGMGFFSRLILVYAGEKQYVDLFTGVQKSAKLTEFLQEDLNSIASLKRDFYMGPETIELWRKHAPSGFPPIPDHSKLQHYNTRRELHILKIAMCMSAAESDELKIKPEHLENAISLLHETEKLMPQIFQEMSTKGYADANEEVWSFAMQTWMSNGKKPVPENAMIRFMTGRVPNNQIRPTLELLISAGQLKQITQPGPGGVNFKCYVPLAK